MKPTIRFTSFIACSVLIVSIRPIHVQADLLPGGSLNDDRISIVYDSSSGEISFDSADVLVSTFLIESNAALLTGAGPSTNLSGQFDVDPLGDPPNPSTLFKLVPTGFTDLSFGSVAQPGLTEDAVLMDLSASGSLLPSGLIGPVDLVYIPIPEPSTFRGALIALFLIAARVSWREPRFGS